MRKELPRQLLQELLKNSKRSDRELAKTLKVSQPTITRTRRKLEKSGLIQDYTIIPNFRKIGFEILALTFENRQVKALVRARSNACCRTLPLIAMVSIEDRLSTF